MNDFSGIITDSEAALCGWCGIPLGSANTFRERVCVRCYRLLINAGIGHEEIFSDGTEDLSRQSYLIRNADENPTES